MKNSNLVVSNIAWRTADKWGSQIISFLISVIIARLLEPSAYGVVAMVNAFINIFGVFSDFGLGESLVQKKDPDSLDYSTVLIANVLLSIIIYLIVFSFAPLISSFYNNEQLCLLVRVSAISILISSFKNIQHAYVAKNFMFKQYFFGSIAGTVGAGVVGIWMAYKGFGAWALVISNLFDVMVDTIVCWNVVKWHITISFSKERLKSLFNFGTNILLANFVERIYSKMYQLVIGRYYSSENLAYFDKGDSLTHKVVDNINNSIGSVLFSKMSSVQDNIEEVKEITRKSIVISTYIMMPIMIGLFGIADNIIVVVFTEKWIHAIPFVKVFCIANIFTTIGMINVNTVKTLGRSDIYIRQQTFKRLISIIVLAISIRFGIMAMAYGCLISRLIDVLMDIYPCNKLIKYSLLDQIKDILPNVVINVLMLFVVLSVGKINVNPLPLMMIQILVGIVSYVVLSIVLKCDAFKYVQEFIIKRK